MENRKIKAVIMAGGMGTRLRPVTDGIPKPLAPICGTPCIKHIVSLLKKHGITEICVSLMYKGEMIKDALRDADGVHIRYFDEDKPLGTAGSVKNCKEFLDTDFLVISGDCLCDFDLRQAIDFHFENGGIASIIFTKVKNPLEYGVGVLDERNILAKYVEKPAWSMVYSNTVNTGIYLFQNKIFDFIDISEGQSDFSKNVFPELMKQDIPIYGKILDGYWCDIGDTKAYLQSNMDMLEGKINGYSFEYKEQVGSPALVYQPCSVGKNVEIKRANIGPNVVIGDRCVIENGARIENSVIMDDVYIGKNVTVRYGVVCSGTKLLDFSSVGEYAIIGGECTIGRNAIICAKSKIHSQNEIPDEALIDGNVFSYTKEISLEEGSISNPSNSLDISKYFHVGAAYGSALQGDIAIGHVSNDLLALSMSVTSGIIATGCNVFDLGVCSKNMLRYVVRKYGLKGGIFITNDDEVTTLSFYLDDGLPVNHETERAFEKYFATGEFQQGNGSLRPFKGFYVLYQRHIRELMGKLKPIKALVIAPSVISEAVTVRNLDFLEHLYVSEDEIVVRTHPDETGKRGSYTQDQIKCALVYVFGKLFGKVYIPYEFPFICDEIAAENGFAVERLTLEDPNRYLLYDILNTDISAALLIRFLSEKQCTFSDIAAKIPKFTSLTEEIESERDKAELMRELSSDTLEQKELVEGVKFYIPSKRGSILIIPEKSLKKFRLYVEAADSETAKELCDIYVKKIRNCETCVEKDTL